MQHSLKTLRVYKTARCQGFIAFAAAASRLCACRLLLQEDIVILFWSCGWYLPGAQEHSSAESQHQVQTTAWDLVQCC